MNIFDFRRSPVMGDVLKYEKKRILGRGTFGEAWLVVSKVSRRSYVMKEMKTGTWAQKEKDQSENEVNILAMCNHINIVKYVGGYRMHKNLPNEKILIIMEYADHGDLSAVIKRQRDVYKQFIPEPQVLNWLIQICFGLQFIHKKNILHRDLKTQNIFLTSQNLIKIGDFGISKSLNNTLDLAHTAIGTPHYLSPEICKREPYGNKSDMWSLGCVLYELCTLKLAFPAENFLQLVQSICRGSYEPISKKFYSSKVSDLIQVLLRPAPERRPSVEQVLSASKLQTEVQTYLSYVNRLKLNICRYRPT
ncbi:serine/threonine-protein kinase Nek5 isoform X2 [Eurytemora carolleeae]|uniref:serine/threonine-protein kinase Nek5 isoform X2 n=1 Tax=Eurytemora carolleeae TaxID=1294199 RepID=UPI000C78F6BA|nr:serine/threonine-protein kinase Nek5 isoform X2 [Eurytemora carolleeae]|eukprot:XP_023331434.1 serine/threonine-protein kinase Nek5-like isoform X2 [Eurytemora affinis]